MPEGGLGGNVWERMFVTESLLGVLTLLNTICILNNKYLMAFAAALVTFLGTHRLELGRDEVCKPLSSDVHLCIYRSYCVVCVRESV